MLHPLPVVSRKGSINYLKVILLFEVYFCGNQLMKTNGITINAEL
jgi:hypothetical protein